VKKIRLFSVFGMFLLLASMLGMVMPAHAQTFSGENGDIAFTAESSVWIMGQNGRHKRKVASNAHSPSWSPDGQTLAFIRRGHVSVLRSHAFKQLTHGNFSEDMPVWSANGSRLAFVRKKVRAGKGQSAIFTVNTKGTEAKNISGWGDYRSPSWSPDGTRLVYETYTESSARLLIHDVRTRATVNLVELSDVTSSSGAMWSPNGKKILYRDSQNEIYTIWPDGTHRAVISDGESYQATWSPKGKNIVFLEDFSGECISMSEEDGTVTWLPVGVLGYDTITTPTCSPDEAKIIFTLRGQAGSGVFMLDRSNGGTVTKVSSAAAAEFSWQAR
jgi:Tol biopolymer transport system component